MKKIGLLNGPNLDRLGKREPEVYGAVTLDEIEDKVKKKAASCNCEIAAFQSNHEGDLIDKIHEWGDAGFSGLILNPGGLTHTSVALRDRATTSPLVLSPTYKRFLAASKTGVLYWASTELLDQS